jgi:hypothetical protein
MCLFLLWKENFFFLSIARKDTKNTFFGFHKFNIYYLDFPDFYLDSRFFIWIPGFSSFWVDNPNKNSFLFGFRLDPTLL